MMELMLAETFLKAIVLSLLLYAIARHEADYSFQTTAIVVAALTLGGLLLEAFLKSWIGPFSALPVLALVIVVVKRFCWVPLPKAILVGVLFSIFSFLLALGIAEFQKRTVKAVDEAMGGPMQSRQKDMKEAIQFQKEVLQLLVPTATVAAVTAAPPARPVATSVVVLAAAPVVTQVATSAVSQVPAPPVAVQALSPEWMAAATNLQVGGIMTDAQGKHVAIVNGKEVEAGDIVTVRQGAKLYRWRVGSVTHDGVQWEPDSIRAAVKRAK